MINFGYVREDSTVNIPFSTNDAAGGAVAPSTAFEAADIVIYKDGGATQKTSTNGLTMTSPFDAITGLHQIDIDTSNDTGDAGFWANGSSYTVILSPDETVDSQTVVAVLASFTLDSDAADESTGSPVKVHTDKGFYDEDATVIIPFVTRNSDGLCTPDSVAVSVYKDDSTTEKSTANGITATIDFDGVTGKHLLVIDTSNNTGDLGFWTADSEYHVDITVTSPSALYNHPDIINIVGVSFIIGTQSVSVSDKTGFSLSADQSSVTIGTVNAMAGTITTLDALDTSQASQHQTTQSAIDYLNNPTVAEIADGVWDELTSGHNNQGTFGRSIKKLYEGLVSAEAAIDDLSATTTSFVTDLTETTDGHYHDLVIAFVTGNLTGSAAIIDTYNGTTKTITLDEELVEAPANGDEFIILTAHVHTVTDIASGIWGNASRTLSSAANITSDSGVINVTSGVVEANIKEINDSSLAATRIALSAAQIIPGTVDTSLVAPTTTSFESDDITEATTGHYNGRVIIFTSGALLGQAVSITGYVLNGSNGVFTVSTMTESPADNVTFIIV